MTTPRRILIIRSGGVGDFILSLPVINSLRTNWPEAEFEVLGKPAIAALARSQVTHITSIDNGRFARLFADAPLDASDPAAIFLASFDLVVSFLGVPESDFGRKLRSLVPRTLFIPAPASVGRHACLQFLDSLQAAGVEATHGIPRVLLTAEDREEGAAQVRRLLGSTPDNRPIMVHPGSGGRHKNWSSQLFAQTVRVFQQAGHRVILLEGEADRAVVGEVVNCLQQDVPLLKDASLVRVAGALACSQLLVGNDSGISHLAAAVGTPVVCLFGPTDPAIWRPVGTAVRVLTFHQATPERVYEEGIRLAKGLTRTNSD